MQKKRWWRKLGFVRKFLSVAICVISVVALLSAHVHVFHHSQVPGFFEFYKLPYQHDIGHQRLRKEQIQTRSLTLPHHLKAPFPKKKLDGASGSLDFGKLWKPPPNRDYVPCVNPSPSYALYGEPRGYLLVHTNGGLNQMRAGICDMVAVARIINATLVIPELDKRSFWQDSSNFSDVFDEEYFINTLANDVRIIKKLPKELSTAPRAVKHFRSWSGINYYQEEIASMWEEYKVIRAAKSDSRLANNNLPPDIQKLRCRACYGALRFAPHIEAMGKLLVDRMRSYGPYIALHLRYEKDMLAFSGCTHDLSPEEAEELRLIRENTAYWKVKDIDSTEQRAKGYCPLTPKEVGMFLSALGFPSHTPIYIAAGEIYGGDTRMADLRSRFPILMDKARVQTLTSPLHNDISRYLLQGPTRSQKEGCSWEGVIRYVIPSIFREKLATVDELEPFNNHASQMASLDYIVSVESDVFIPSYSGNMAMAVEGHRRFLGHRKTISPDRKLLVRLFDKVEQGTMKEGRNLSDRIIEVHRRRVGSPRKRKGPIPGTKGTDRFRSEEPFYVNPLPDCLCRKDFIDVNGSFIH